LAPYTTRFRSGVVALPGKVLQRRVDQQMVTTAIGQTLLSEGHYPGPAQPGELAGGGDRRRLDAEQRHEQALLASVVLVRRIPDGAAGTQHLEHGAHVFALDRGGIAIVALATTALDEIEDRIL